MTIIIILLLTVLQLYCYYRYNYYYRFDHSITAIPQLRYYASRPEHDDLHVLNIRIAYRQYILLICAYMCIYIYIHICIYIYIYIYTYRERERERERDIDMCTYSIHNSKPNTITSHAKHDILYSVSHIIIDHILLCSV